MPKVKTRIYSGSKDRTMESMLQVSENTLKELGMEIVVQYLDKTLIECKGKPPAGTPMGKENVCTIYKEGDKIYIKFTYAMEDPDAFWNLFEANLQIYSASTSEIEQKARIVSNICKTIREMGAQVDEEEAWDFLYNYEKSFQRLPMEDEYTPIAMDFIKLRDEEGVVQEKDAFVEQTPQPVIEEIKPQEEQPIEEGGITITPTDALKEMIKKFRLWIPKFKIFTLKCSNPWHWKSQKRLVTKIIAIEGNLNKIPYLLDNERKKIRKDVMELATEKRREKLLKLIKERQKNEAMYMAKYVEQQLKDDLLKLPFLTKKS